MEITYNGHSCFTITSSAGTLLLDPYEDNRVPGYGLLRATVDKVLCSHDHRDHGAVEVIALTGNTDSYQVEAIHTFHDDAEGAKRGLDLIHIITVDGLRIAHFGDLGCALTDAQIEKLKGVDAALIPVGGFFTIDAQQAKEMVGQIQPTVTIPMHYRLGALGYEAISELSAFTDLCDDVVAYEGNRITIEKGMPRQTAVLTYIAP